MKASQVMTASSPSIFPSIAHVSVGKFKPSTEQNQVPEEDIPSDKLLAYSDKVSCSS